MSPEGGPADDDHVGDVAQVDLTVAVVIGHVGHQRRHDRFVETLRADEIPLRDRLEGVRRCVLGAVSDGIHVVDDLAARRDRAGVARRRLDFQVELRTVVRRGRARVGGVGRGDARARRVVVAAAGGAAVGSTARRLAGGRPRLKPRVHQLHVARARCERAHGHDHPQPRLHLQAHDTAEGRAPRTCSRTAREFPREQDARRRASMMAVGADRPALSPSRDADANVQAPGHPRRRPGATRGRAVRDELASRDRSPRVAAQPDPTGVSASPRDGLRHRTPDPRRGHRGRGRHPDRVRDPGAKAPAGARSRPIAGVPQDVRRA